MTRIRRVRGARVWALSGAACACLQACAINPLVQWTEPQPAPADKVPRVMDYAHSVSEAARAAYRAKLNDQVQMTTQLTSGLIGLGGIMTALAVGGKGNHDAVVGTGIFGGTAYAEGSWNLDQRRLQIYGKAIDAFDCADRALQSYDMKRSDRQALETAVPELGNAIADLQTDQARLAALATAAPSNAPTLNEMQAALVRAIAAAQAAQASGKSLMDTTDLASQRLIDTVHRVDGQARDLLATTTGDLAKVQGAVSGITSGFTFTPPGASGTTALGAAGKSGANQGLAGQQPNELLALVQTINAHLGTVYRLTQQVVGIAGQASAPPDMKGLADCGLGTISLGMSADPSTVVAPAGSAYARSVSIKGGKPPYMIQPDGVVVSTVTAQIVDPRSSDRIDVKVLETTPAATAVNFVILDNSVPANRLPFVVQVVGSAPPPALAAPAVGAKKHVAAPAPAHVAASAPAAAPAATPAASSTPVHAASPAVGGIASAPSLASTLQAVRRFPGMNLSGVDVTMATGPAVSGNAVLVTLGCKPPSTQAHCLVASALHDKFFAKLPDGDVMRSLVQFQESPSGRCSCSQ